MAGEIEPVKIAPAPLNYAAPSPDSRGYASVAWAALAAAVLPGACALLLLGLFFLPVVILVPLVAGLIACAGATIWLMVLMVRRGTGIVSLELIAAIGFLFIALVPVIHETAMLVGLGCLAMASVRHIPVYGALSRWCRALGHRHTADVVRVLGFSRAVYECCWFGIMVVWALTSLMHMRLGLDAIAYYGLYGYGALWIWMIVSHARLVQVLGRG